MGGSLRAGDVGTGDLDETPDHRDIKDYWHVHHDDRQ
jgi:hypothetical protein